MLWGWGWLNNRKAVGWGWLNNINVVGWGLLRNRNIVVVEVAEKAKMVSICSLKRIEYKTIV